MDKKEISLMDLLKLAVRWIYLLLAGIIICGVVLFIYSKYFVVPKFEASTKYCIQTRGQSVESDVLDSQRTVAYAQLVLGTYIDILDTRDFAEEIIFYLNGNVRETDSKQKKDNIKELLQYIPEGKTYKANAVKEMITYKSEEEKISFDVSVKSGSYKEAFAIACCVEAVASDYIEEKYPGVGVVTVIDKAVLSDKPINNMVLVMTLAGALFGLILAMTLAYVIESTDTRVKDEKSLAEKTGLAVIGVIPDMSSDSAGKKQTEGKR